MSKRTIAKSPQADTPINPGTSAALLDPPVKPEETRQPVRRSRAASPVAGVRRFSAFPHDDHASNHQAELFYLQKQIQLQTQMVFVMEDGARVQGVVEWYDRNSIKVRGKSRVLIYKSAIKYLFKAGEVGTAPEA